ncbi:MAG: hypothetical protein R3F54_20770 [Alphaproteobacteria bacterium]
MPLLPALLITLSSAVLAGATSLGAPASGKVGIVFSPGLPEAEAVRRVVAAGGLPINVGAFENIVVAWAESPGFPSRVRDEGAWLVVDPQSLGGCLRPLL